MLRLTPLLDKIEISVKWKLPSFKLTKEIMITGWDVNLSKNENKSIAPIIFNLKWEIWLNRNQKKFHNKTSTTNEIFKKVIWHQGGYL